MNRSDDLRRAVAAIREQLAAVRDQPWSIIEELRHRGWQLEVLTGAPDARGAVAAADLLTDGVGHLRLLLDYAPRLPEGQRAAIDLRATALEITGQAVTDTRRRAVTVRAYVAPGAPDDALRTYIEHLRDDLDQLLAAI